jgi:large subunit ribosomal protein L15e
MSSYKYIQQTFQKEYHVRSPEYRAKLTKWRKEPAVVRVDAPTNIASARFRGYKAKKGFVIVRVRIIKGKRKREKPNKGRKPSKYGRFFSRHKSLQNIAEERANKHFPGLEVLNSYWVGADGSNKFFEIILVDPRLVDLPLQKGRVFRSMTRTGRKVRGLYSSKLHH